ncbi:hypothetical protein ACROYT_G041804 [Oculina patagonica]
MWWTVAFLLTCFADIARGSGSGNAKRSEDHPLPRSLPESKLNDLAQRTDYQTFYDDIFLKGIYHVRVPGTTGHHKVKMFIKKKFEDLNWTVTLDEFDDITPLGPKRFTNIIATLNPNAKRRLIFAAHYDSKYFPPDKLGKGSFFMAATDSAMPCAMLIEIAKIVTPLFKARQQQEANMPEADDEQSDVTLQMVFFDGEEAFEQWTKTDSLYGARHLAQNWSNTIHPKGSNSTMIDSITAFVLLDLIGASNPVFYNSFKETNDLFERMQLIERRLMSSNQISRHTQPYFFPRLMDRGYLVEDDHIPFLERNVKVLHLISLPFPPCWHKGCDNKESINHEVVKDLLKIFQVFVVEYFGLSVV